MTGAAKPARTAHAAARKKATVAHATKVHLTKVHTAKKAAHTKHPKK